MSLKIGITGSSGLVGWHVRAWLRVNRPDAAVSLADRATFADKDALAAFTSSVDVLIHCAGINRGEDRDVEHGNIELARLLAEACERADIYPRIVYTNSTHSERDSSYGRGKRNAGEILKSASEKRETPCANLVLPHIFGEFGRPFYNSVVSTFSHQLANGAKPEIDVDGNLELIHAQDVAARCIAAGEHAEHGDVRVAGTPMKVNALLDLLSAMAVSYFDHKVLPNMSEPLHRDLFNTLRSYRFPRFAETHLTKHDDVRGGLVEVVKSLNGGQTFFSTTRPSVTRGNHFHTRKFERFLVCAGQAEIKLRRLFSPEVFTFKVFGRNPCSIDMPTFYTHSITNVGDSDVITLFWANEIFDPDRPDTVTEPVVV